MDYNRLGFTELIVSKLCFGALTIGPLQANLPLNSGVRVLQEAFSCGVNFIDTAELYQNYHYIAKAIKHCPQDIIITSKSYAYSSRDMENSVANACKSIERDYIDIFMLHEQTSRLTLRGHHAALEYLVKAKKDGIIRAIGVSTHTVEVTRAVALLDEVDIIHPILNVSGIGICDGTVSDMIAAIDFAAQMGKGIYTMKALGGGHLANNAPQAIQWILNQPNIHSVAVGMQTTAEVKLNTKLFLHELPEYELLSKVNSQPRKLLIESWCTGCGSCASKCPMAALSIIDNQATVNDSICVRCGYCGAYCPEFCLKII